jgi:hypothetical protein
MVCEAGSYKVNVYDTDQSQCGVCPADFYCPRGTAINGAIACPIDTYSPAGSTSVAACGSCAAGQAPISGTCTNCTAGNAITFIHPCLISCPYLYTVNVIGTYSVAGATSCTACPLGQYQPNEGQTRCFTCDSGSFSDNAGAAVCTPCAAGLFGNTTGLSSCTPCTIGTFTDITGQIACEPCPAATYAPAEGSTTCASCPSQPSSMASFIGLPACCANGLTAAGVTAVTNYGTAAYSLYKAACSAATAIELAEPVCAACTASLPSCAVSSDLFKWGSFLYSLGSSIYTGASTMADLIALDQFCA